MRNAIGGPCYHCGRTASPCWRRGPPDKPVLCNACGARWLTKKTLLGYTPGQHRGVSQQATPAADADDCSYNLVVPAVLKRKREHAFRNTLATFHGPPLFLPPPVERSPTNVSNSSHSSLSSLTLKAPTDDSSAASTMDSTKPLPAPAPLLTTWQPLLHSSALPHAVPANSGSPVSSTGPRPQQPQQHMHVSLLLSRTPLAALRSPLGPLLIPQQQEQQQQEASAVPALPHRRPRKQQRPQPCGAV